MNTWISRNHLWRWLYGFQHITGDRYVHLKSSSLVSILEMIKLFFQEIISRDGNVYFKELSMEMVSWFQGIISGCHSRDDGSFFKESSLMMEVWNSRIYRLRRICWIIWQWVCGFQSVFSGKDETFFRDWSLEVEMWISSHYLWRWICGFQATISGDGCVDFKSSSVVTTPEMELWNPRIHGIQGVISGDL